MKKSDEFHERTYRQSPPTWVEWLNRLTPVYFIIAGILFAAYLIASYVAGHWLELTF